MKKRFIAIIVALGLCLTACGQITEETTVSDAESAIDETTIAEEVISDNVAVDNSEETSATVIYNITVDSQAEVDSSISISNSTVEEISFIYKEAEMPYYVGAESSSFLASLETYDYVLYLGHNKYITEVFTDAKVVSIEDSEILECDSYKFYPKKQGTTNVYVTTEDGTTTCYIVAVTTFNDGKDVTKQYSSLFTENGCRGLSGSYETCIPDPELIKDNVNTIMDAVAFLSMNGFNYCFVEPVLPFVCDEDGINSVPWSWLASGDILINYTGGVCIESAQLINYLLADDFEDWGNVLIHGNQGHIFNWFYEDGYYYLMDFTDVTSNRSSILSGYSLLIKKFATQEEIAEWIQTEKVDISQNAFVCMYSCKGHDYLPCFCNPFMNGTNYDDSVTENVVRFEECVINDDQWCILWQDPSLNIIVEGVPSENLPEAVKLSKSACYGIQVVNYGY